MKLHRIRLQNLNSLYGEHTVDFDSDLREAPLFLIVGPTGAGKSTIMDGVSLALFARTPRLGGRSGDEDPRMVMSRGTGQCLAEVVFSKQKPGQKRRYYRATWDCRRAHGKPGGRLQTVRRSLYEIDRMGLEIEKLADDTVAKRYDDAFANVLEGLTPDEFQRSMLLAQGQFSAFLRASIEERAVILERLTSTEIYRDIGARGFRKWQEASRQVDAIRNRVEAIDLLGAAELEVLRGEVEVARAEATAAESRHERSRRREAWYTRRGQLVNDLVDAREDLDKASKQWARYEDKRKRLEESDRCAAAGEKWRRIESADKELRNDQARLRLAADQLAEVEKARDAAAKATDEAKLALEASTKALEAALPRIVEAGELEHEVDRHAEAARRCEKLREAAAAATADRRAAKTRLQKLADDLVEARARREVLATRVEETGRALVVHLEDHDNVGATRRARAAERSELERRESELKELAAALRAVADDAERASALAEQIEKARTQREGASQRASDAEEQIEAHQGMLVAEQDHLETALLAQKYVAERRSLAADQPCPVCGLLEHPWAHDDADADVLQQRLEAQRAKLAALEGKLAAARDSLTRALAERDGIDARLTELDEARFALDAKLVEARAGIEEAAATAELSAESSVVAEAHARLAARRAELEASLQEFEDAVAAREEASAALERHDEAQRASEVEASKLEGSVEGLARNAEERENELRAEVERIADAAAALGERVQALAGDRAVELSQPPLPQELSRALVVALDGQSARTLQESLESAEDAARQHATALESKHTELSAGAKARSEALEATRAEIARREKLLAAERQELEGAIAELGMESVEALARCVLTHEERQLLGDEIATVKTRLDAATSNVALVTRQLAEHDEACPPGFDPAGVAKEDLDREVTDSAGALETARNTRAELEAELKQQEEDRERMSGLLAELDAAEENVVLWDEMRKLIGVNEGGGFQRFAQTLNLAELVSKANIRLRELEPRYSLVVSTDKDGNPELAFAVCDHEHADRVRPQTTLSGGETFLVSLALALALSDYRQTEMPIETLLLDEGFGTLDAETLDVAMGALERLCAAGGTQIGVISHVEALKERIGAQVVVDKLGGGRSALRVLV